MSIKLYLSPILILTTALSIFRYQIIHKIFSFYKEFYNYIFYRLQALTFQNIVLLYFCHNLYQYYLIIFQFQNKLLLCFYL